MDNLESLRRLTSDTPIEEIVRVLRAHPDVRPGQFDAELVNLMGRLKVRPPKNVLEIGTLYGGTVMALSRVAAPGACLITVDNGINGVTSCAAVLAALALPGQTITALKMDSHLDATRDYIQEQFGEHGVDFLHIDGDHTYKGVWRDYELYAPLVRIGGLIAFHDIVHPGPRYEADCAVRVFWKELREKAERGLVFDEIIQSQSQGYGGIGLVAKVEVPA